MKLQRGYSRNTIAGNYNALIGAGVEHRYAVAQAHGSARVCYWERYPAGHLPAWIWPDLAHGRVGPANRTGSMRARTPRSNPAPRVNTVDPFDADGAARLYARFAGKEADTSAKMRKPTIPDALACIGQVTVIQYIAERDGEVNEYRHPFKAKSRPHLCITADGKLVLMLGGAFTFTDDGFVDE